MKKTAVALLYTIHRSQDEKSKKKMSSEHQRTKKTSKINHGRNEVRKERRENEQKEKARPPTSVNTTMCLDVSSSL
jgi:hypothetical protein